jgi:serine protease Do
MPIYNFSVNLPDFKEIRKKTENWLNKIWNNKRTMAVILIVGLIICAITLGIIFSNHLYEKVEGKLNKFAINNFQNNAGVKEQEYSPQTSQEEAIIRAVKEASPAVVSIVISKDVPVMEQYFVNPFNDPFFNFQIPQYRQKGTEKQEIGGGTGFIVSEDGLILTNKHVVSDEQADYTVFTNDGKKFTAKVLARDPVQDLAIIKIESSDKFPIVRIGNSDNIQIGQSAIAIGNALGEFRNTVSAGVISGLGRTVNASGASVSETLEDIIQTDAAINPGNSGGPLLNLKGEVIGINTAMASGAQSIGFAIPINKAKKDITQIKSSGKITYPFLGIRYTLINEKIKEDKKLSVDYGAYIAKGQNGEAAVQSGSVAEKAGIKEGDIILEFNNEKITQDNSLAKVISKYNPGDKVSLKILRDGKEIVLDVVLGERAD